MWSCRKDWRVRSSLEDNGSNLGAIGGHGNGDEKMGVLTNIQGHTVLCTYVPLLTFSGGPLKWKKW